MIAEIKRGIKLIRYGYGVKANLIGGAILCIVGILMCCLANNNLIMIGTLYIVLGPIMIIQVMYTFLYSGLVGASPRRRGIEILIADWINIITGFIGYVVFMVVTIVRVNAAPEQAQNIMQGTLLGSVGSAAAFICFGVCYKYYWQSMILFFVVFFSVYAGGMVIMNIAQVTLNMAWTAGGSLVFIAAGVFLSCVLRRLVYKKGLSPTACGTSLRKAMQ